MTYMQLELFLLPKIAGNENYQILEIQINDFLDENQMEELKIEAQTDDPPDTQEKNKNEFYATIRQNTNM